MVSVAQSVEHQVVALVVVGSSPITHPLFNGLIVQWLGHRVFDPATGVRFSLRLHEKSSVELLRIKSRRCPLMVVIPAKESV